MPTTAARMLDAWRRLGAAGIVGALWTRAFGRLADVRLFIEWSLDTRSTRFAPVPGFGYEQVKVDERSAAARAAAELMGVCVGDRLTYDLFVVRDAAGDVVGCTWNDLPDGRTVRQRGVVVASGFRGRSLGGSLLRFQAVHVAAAGIDTILYRTAIGNRASRRMFHGLGAAYAGATLLVVMRGRPVLTRALHGAIDACLRWQWKRERERVSRSSAT